MDPLAVVPLRLLVLRDDCAFDRLEVRVRQSSHNRKLGCSHLDLFLQLFYPSFELSLPGSPSCRFLLHLGWMRCFQLLQPQYHAASDLTFDLFVSIPSGIVEQLLGSRSQQRWWSGCSRHLANPSAFATCRRVREVVGAKTRGDPVCCCFFLSIPILELDHVLLHEQRERAEGEATRLFT